MLKFILVLLLVICSLNLFAQTDSLQINQVDSLIQQNRELSEALRIYGKQQVIANYISIISFGTVIIGTICGIPVAPLLLTTGICDGITLVITGRAARRLAHRKKY